MSTITEVSDSDDEPASGELAGSARPEPRSAQEIFEDIRALAQSDGALHAISSLLYRDWIVTVDLHEAKVVDDPEARWSTSKLNKNELLLLLGLMVQAPTNSTHSVIALNESFIASADSLLREFHDRLIKDCRSTFDPETGMFTDLPNSVGLVAREAIYYGPEGFYAHQFVHFTRQRYRQDMLWMLRNVGASIRPMLDIAKFVVDRVNAQMTGVGHMRSNGESVSKEDFTNSLIVSKKDIEDRFGARADAFLSRFASPAFDTNHSFDSPFAVNAVALAPLIDLGDFVYVPLQYRLYESIYESPFFWMMADKDYASTHAKNRGDFLEQSASQLLTKVFGKGNVFENVTIERNRRERAGEIDVLVVYGEFVLVAQAKSKRVTLKARAGDAAALTNDFAGAIQDPYEQALDCIDLIRSGGECVSPDGRRIELHKHPRFFPMVILSDTFPASTTLSRTMLKRESGTAPVIWDLGVLDAVTRVLSTPVELLYFLKCRSDAFDKIFSDSEYNYLGYHLGSKLALPDEADFMILERDFATVVDDYMIGSDLGLSVSRPVGILERVEIPVISDLLRELKSADPLLASVVIDLYGFSGPALEQLSSAITRIREEIRTTRKEIKALSIPTESGGITYAVVLRRDKKAAEMAEMLGRKHKYDTKSDRWYVILDCVGTDNPVDGLLPLVSTWVEDEEVAKASRDLGSMFKSTFEQPNRRRPEGGHPDSGNS
ncbi:nuclease-related domain-containing protein [Rhizobium leguminosarum]